VQAYAANQRSVPVGPVSHPVLQPVAHPSGVLPMPLPPRRRNPTALWVVLAVVVVGVVVALVVLILPRLLRAPDAPSQPGPTGTTERLVPGREQPPPTDQTTYGA
jgi:serine/threonine-protein kinase